MQETSLAKYLETNSQAKLAEAVGCHQTLISRLFRTERKITVVTYDNGKVELREDKIHASKSA